MSRRTAERARLPFAGTVAVVTGAGRGIGRATALALAERGATVACADIDVAAAEKVAVACEEAGAPAATGYIVDVADRATVEELAGAVAADHSPAGILVNNAGVGLSGRFADMDHTDWAWIRQVNLDGVVHGCSVFGPAMLAAGRGHVVNVSSALGYTVSATEPAYVTTKAGVLALSQCLRADWARHGVGVSAICPGVINTEIIDHTRFVGEVDNPARRRRVQRLFRRGHHPAEVAAAIVDAIDRDRALVPVGIEARLGWWLHRFAPVGLQQTLARMGR